MHVVDKGYHQVVGSKVTCVQTSTTWDITEPSTTKLEILMPHDGYQIKLTQRKCNFSDVSFDTTECLILSQ